jgi:hypothetical protein
VSAAADFGALIRETPSAIVPNVALPSHFPDLLYPLDRPANTVLAPIFAGTSGVIEVAWPHREPA